MTTVEYAKTDDGFRFDYDEALVSVANIVPTRTGGLVAYVKIQERSDDGQYLNAGKLDLTDSRQRQIFAAEGARRNSGDVGAWDTRLLEISIILDGEMNGGSARASAPLFTPLPEFLQGVSHERDDLVDGLLERGGCYLLGARYKVGKTLLSMNLGLVAARGGRWLGRKIHGPGPVHWVQLEDPPRIIARRWQMMIGLAPSGIHIARGPWVLTDDNVEATISAMTGSVLVIVDPVISSVRVSNWNDMAEVRAAYDLWREVAQRTNAVVLLLAHHRKMDGDGGDQVAGSHQAGAAVDGILEMRKSGNGLDDLERRLSFTGRDWPDLDDEIIRLDPQTLVFARVGSQRERSEAQKTERLPEDAKAILVYVSPPGERMGKTTLRKALGWKQDRFNAALEYGITRGLVIVVEALNERNQKTLYVERADGGERA